MCNPQSLSVGRPRRGLDWRGDLRSSVPHTRAYREIWLDGERIAGGEEEVVEPIYGRTYLPRKFKIASRCRPRTTSMCSPTTLVSSPSSTTRARRRLQRHRRRRHGHDPWRAGHLSAHRRRVGFCRPRLLAVAEAVVTVQRDWGNRANRKHARLKYTIEDRGLDAFRAEVEQRAGVKFAPARPYAFTSMGDRYGWSDGDDGRAHLTVFVENGRVQDARTRRAAAFGPAAHRRNARRRHSSHAKPEHHRRQYAGRAPGRSTRIAAETGC